MPDIIPTLPDLPFLPIRELLPEESVQITGGRSVRRLLPPLDRWPALPGWLAPAPATTPPIGLAGGRLAS